MRVLADFHFVSDVDGVLSDVTNSREASHLQCMLWELVVLPRHFLLYEGPIGGSAKCHCKRGASYCVTVTSVTVSGESCNNTFS